MKPTKELIKDLTKAQREAIIRMQQEGIITSCDYHKNYILRRLVNLGIFECTSRPGAGTHLFVLSPDWDNVNVNLPPRERKRPIPWEVPPVIPDPPKKKMQRPPAVYSNRSSEELIDQILKNY